MYDDLFKLYVEWIDYFMRNRFNKFIEKIVKFIDDTWWLLVIFSDHWEDWSNKSKWHSNSISDKVLKVPLILYWKWIPKWSVKDDLIRTIDLLPTILDINWIKIKNKIDWKKIDLNWKNNDRDCFAQVWRVWDKKKIMLYQKKFLNNSKYIRPLKTNLEKEICFNNDLIFSKEYHWTNITKKLYLNKINCIQEVDIDSNLDKAEFLEYKLKTYNNKKKDNKNNKVHFKMQNELRALWYNI
jgi:hypothetical protein